MPGAKHILSSSTATIRPLEELTIALPFYDRMQADEIIMTQELIANMLGVRREGVTVFAGQLQDMGLISYVRGRIKILDRKKLESTTCECYRVVKNEFDRLLG